MLVLQSCPRGLWVHKTRGEQSRVLTVLGKRSGFCRATLLCSLSLSQLVPTSGSRPATFSQSRAPNVLREQSLHAATPPSPCGFSVINTSFCLPLPQVDDPDSLVLLPERTFLLFSAHSSTPAVTAISRPYLPLATCPEFFVILVETVNIHRNQTQQNKLESCGSHTNPHTLERNFCPSLLSGTDHALMVCMATQASS